MNTTAPDITLQQEEEQILTAAVRKAMAKVKKDATVQNLKGLEATKKALADFQAQAAARIRPEERPLKNLREVYAYLAEEKGYKVSERKIYDDKRLISKQADGSYLVKHAEDYAAQYLLKKDGSDDSETGQSAIKAQKENELLEEKIKRERRRNQIESGKLILRSKVDQQLAARAAFLIADLETFAHGKLPEIAEQALDTTNPPEGLDDYLQELRGKIGPELSSAFLGEMRKWLDRYSQPLQFQAPMISDDELEDEDHDEDAE